MIQGAKGGLPARVEPYQERRAHGQVPHRGARSTPHQPGAVRLPRAQLHIAGQCQRRSRALTLLAQCGDQRLLSQGP